MKRTVNLSKRHDDILLEQSGNLGVSYTETIQRALEALEEKEARRERELKGAPSVK
jgi:hypothetical protein